MKVQQQPHDEALPAASPMPPGRKKWNWHRVAQGAWIVLALVLLVIFVANLPTYFQYVRTVCTLNDISNCETDQLAPIYVQIFHQLHIPAEVAAGFFAALTFTVAMLYWVVGLLIFWRRSGEWMGLLASFLLVMFGSIGLVGINATVQTPQLLQLLNNIFGNFVLAPTLFLFLFIFPTGRFTPRWTLVAFVLVFVMGVLTVIEVVQETMQPTQVSLWLRQPIRKATPSLQTSKAPTEEAREREQGAGHGV